jgi:hypothetical protein
LDGARGREVVDEVAPLQAAGFEQWPMQLLGIPASIVYLSIVLGIAGLAAAARLWRPKRWRVWLTIIVRVLGILSAAPGLTEAPNSLLRVLATGGFVDGAWIILLVVLANLRRTHT